MRNLDISTSLKNFPILSHLTEEEIEFMVSRGEVSSYDRNDSIYKEGEDGRNVYFILRGKVKLVSNTSTGHQLIKAVIHPEELFGENVFRDKNLRQECAVPLKGNVEVMILKKEDLMHVLMNNRKFMQAMLQLNVERLQTLEKRMENFIFRKAKSRISDFLARMANTRGIRIGLDELLINHGLSHKEIAYMTDTSRQTVARVLSELKKDNFIHFSARKPSKILIRDIASLSNVK